MDTCFVDLQFRYHQLCSCVSSDFLLSVKQDDSFRLLRMSISELLDDASDCMHSPGKTMSNCAEKNCNQNQKGFV